ncbi:hypothetical protein [Salinirubrum litoreum]|uniref:DUF7999 domain-containing protein n=1 Tax=Salinirubrum litoreum TaxID=1126234 RepID=A0ABD5R842_9EURY|nr:hypothetical protein [Salinirubrum litoreum]
MSGTTAVHRGQTHRVTKGMNDYGAMTLTTRETHETKQVVGYSSPHIKTRLEALEEGETVRLNLRRAGSRGNVWEVAELLPGR